MSLAGSNGKSGAAASREISLACQQTMQARIRVRDRHGSCPKQTVVLTIQFSSMEHHAFHVPYLLDTTPEAAFHGQAVKTVVYLRVSTTQQVLGPEARTPEGLAGRLTARWQGGRNPALPRTGRFQDRHRQVWTCPVPPSTAHEHPRAQAEPLACIPTRILSVPYPRERDAHGHNGNHFPAHASSQSVRSILSRPLSKIGPGLRSAASDASQLLLIRLFQQATTDGVWC